MKTDILEMYDNLKRDYDSLLKERTREIMYVMPRKDLDKHLLMPYRKLVLEEHGGFESIEEGEDGYIPSNAYPLKLIHSDNRGYLILLLDEHDDDSTIITQSIDFDFETVPREEHSMSNISDAFETVTDYIESDNESDMNQAILDLIAILRDLQDKAIGEEIDGHYREEQNITTLYVVDGENGEVIEQPINNDFNIDVNNEYGYASMLFHGVSIYFTKEEAEEKLKEEN